MSEILVIQDSPSVGEVLKARLELEGFSVEVAGTGEEGLKKAREGRRDLILLDVRLPGMDGREVCRILKKDKKTKEIPVLFLSAQEEEELSKIVQEAGADGFIRAPYEGAQLIGTMRRWLRPEEAEPGASARWLRSEEKPADVSSENEWEIPATDEDLYPDKGKEAERTEQFVSCRLGNEWYALPIQSVREVMPVGQIAYLPSAPAQIAGITSIRGNILSVTDPKRLLGLSETPATPLSRIVVIEAGAMETGLLVDEVLEVAAVPVSHLEPPLETLAPERAGYVKQTCRVNTRLVAILRIEALLGQHSVTDG